MYIKGLVLAVLVLLIRRCSAKGPDFGSRAKVSCDGKSFYKQTALAWPNQKEDCSYTFKAHSWFVCQLRVDFDIDLAPQTTATLTDGSAYEECVDDYLQIGPYKFCGNDKQQHVYLPFNRTAGQKEIILRMFVKNRSENRGLIPARWDIRVTQLECSLGSPLRSLSSRTFLSSIIKPRTFFNDGFWIAPTGCLQYYPHAQGELTSFNYKSGTGFYPGSLDYAICFRRTSATQSLQLTTNYFKMSETTTEPFDGACRSQIDMPQRYDDYLSIPEAQIEGSGIRASLFCGTIAPSTQITSKSFGPLILLFHSDKNHLQAAKKYGFSFNYKIL